MPARTGTAHHLAKLTPELVREIRRLKQDGLSGVKIAAAIDYVVGESTVYAVTSGRTWRHVE